MARHARRGYPSRMKTKTIFSALVLPAIALAVGACAAAADAPESTGTSASALGLDAGYQVYEANRIVFLYPESFLAPELRDAGPWTMPR
jgi:hypothetical protein